MNAATQGSAVLALRYRPMDDILFAQLDLTGLGDDTLLLAAVGDEVEQIDADCAVSWATIGTRRVLRSVQVIGPAARLRQGRFPTLPAAVTEAAQALIERSMGSGGSSTSSTSPISLSVMLSLDELSSPADHSVEVSARVPAPLAAARSLCAALLHLASAIAGEVDTAVRDRDVDDVDDVENLLPARRFVMAAQELAGVIAEHRRPAPGLAARAVELVRGGLPLSTSERTLLRQALTDIDQPTTWRAVARGLDALAHTIDDQRRQRTEQP
jgi:hypothetical protein